VSVEATQQVLAGDTPVAAYELRGARAFWRDVLRHPSAACAAFVLAIFVFVAIFGHLIAPHSPYAIQMGDVLANPSRDHLLGTDSLGRDNFSRLIYGARIALEVALPAVLGAFVVGGLLGTAAGYLGGPLDAVLVVIFDVLISFPVVILALALLTLLGSSLGNLDLVIGLALVPYYGRLMRAQTLAEKTNPYVKAERSLGVSRFLLLRRHILPNVLPPLLIVVAMDIPGAIAAEAGLAFLGLGLQPPTPDWGVMLSDGFNYLSASPWEMLGPLAAIIVVTTAFTVLGETMRDTLDPAKRLPRRRFGWRHRKLDETAQGVR
jgi:peptide/nickel transport system permease protein